MEQIKHFERDGGTLAYSDAGSGPLVVCVPGIGDLRQEYRFLTPQLLEAGFRVVAMDLRGHGQSSTGWGDHSPEAIGGDVLALIRDTGSRQAVLVGTSMAAGAAVWAAAEEPNAVAGLVLIGPFVRDVGPAWRQLLLRVGFRALSARPWGAGAWMRFWASLYPTRKPADFESYSARLRANLAEPGRLEAMRAMMLGPSRSGIERRLAAVRAPALVVMGTRDSDFPEPRAEAELIAGRLHGRTAMVEGAGHYPHVEFASEAGRVIVDFVRRAYAGEASGAA
jgi:pimeloyl-ACP methyl ester carboxylesterase